MCVRHYNRFRLIVEFYRMLSPLFFAVQRPIRVALFALTSSLILAACNTAPPKLQAWAPAPVAPKENTVLSVEQVKRGYIEHAALTQLHRWYLPYENNAVPIENQLDILTEDVRVKSGLGEAVGHSAYKQRFGEIPKTWKNAHRVTDSQVSVLPDGAIELQAQIEYLNQGANSDGSLRAARLKYTTQLKPTATVLPRFSILAIAPVGTTTTSSYSDAYAENRLKSLTHYWLALIEDPARRIEPFKEVLAQDFRLDFSSSVITDPAGFEKWFRGPASSVAASTHKISNFSYRALSANTYAMSVDFDWQGILPNGAQMKAKTRHNWTVEDKPSERFARIKTIKVEVLAPFTPI
jgi:hypothetical protein